MAANARVHRRNEVMEIYGWMKDCKGFNLPDDWIFAFSITYLPDSLTYLMRLLGTDAMTIPTDPYFYVGEPLSVTWRVLFPGEYNDKPLDETVRGTQMVIHEIIHVSQYWSGYYDRGDTGRYGRMEEEVDLLSPDLMNEYDRFKETGRCESKNGENSACEQE